MEKQGTLQLNHDPVQIDHNPETVERVQTILYIADALRIRSRRKWHYDLIVRNNNNGLGSIDASANRDVQLSKQAAKIGCDLLNTLFE